MIPHNKVFPDMLHMYTNEWNDIGHEGVHRHLVEPHTDKLGDLRAARHGAYQGQ